MLPASGQCQGQWLQQGASSVRDLGLLRASFSLLLSKDEPAMQGLGFWG